MEFPVEEQITVYDGGWVRYRRHDLGATVFLRFRETAGSLRVSETVIAELTNPPQEVRRIPFGRLTVFANTDDSVRRKLYFPGPELETLFDMGNSPWSVSRDISAQLPATKTPDFYERVAQVHTSLSGLFRNPVTMMADANHVPVSTAYRWVRRAREKGLL